MSLNKVKSDGSLEKVAGLANSEKINEMYEAFPSNASASNKLVTESDVDYFYQTSDVEGEYDANDFAVVGKTTRYCVKSPVHGYQVDGTAWWGFYETVCFRGSGYGYQTFRTMLGMPAMAIRQLYSGSWGSWQKFVTRSDISYLSKDKIVYHQETGDNLLYLASRFWQLETNKAYIVQVVADDKNSPANNWFGIIKFTYDGVASITNIETHKLGGTGMIDATNNNGTVQFSFVKGLPEVAVTFMG